MGFAKLVDVGKKSKETIVFWVGIVLIIMLLVVGIPSASRHYRLYEEGLPIHQSRIKILKDLLNGQVMFSEENDSVYSSTLSGLYSHPVYWRVNSQHITLTLAQADKTPINGYLIWTIKDTEVGTKYAKDKGRFGYCLYPAGDKSDYLYIINEMGKGYKSRAKYVKPIDKYPSTKELAQGWR